MIQLCNLLFCERCWSENYDLAWNTLKQESKHNPTFQFRHLNLVQANIKHCFPLWTFKFHAEHTWQYVCLPFWGQWSLFCTFCWLLVEGVGLPCGVLWGWSTLTPPINLWIRGAQFWDCVLSVHCFTFLTVTFMELCLHCQVPCFSLKAFLKYLALRIQLLGTCVANTACLLESNAYSILHLVLYTVA